MCNNQKTGNEQVIFGTCMFSTKRPVQQFTCIHTPDLSQPCGHPQGWLKLRRQCHTRAALVMVISCLVFRTFAVAPHQPRANVLQRDPVRQHSGLVGPCSAAQLLRCPGGLNGADLSRHRRFRWCSRGHHPEHRGPSGSDSEFQPSLFPAVHGPHGQSPRLVHALSGEATQRQIPSGQAQDGPRRERAPFTRTKKSSLPSTHTRNSLPPTRQTLTEFQAAAKEAGNNQTNSSCDSL